MSIDVNDLTPEALRGLLLLADQMIDIQTAANNALVIALNNMRQSWPAECADQLADQLNQWSTGLNNIMEDYKARASEVAFALRGGRGGLN